MLPLTPRALASLLGLGVATGACGSPPGAIRGTAPPTATPASPVVGPDAGVGARATGTVAATTSPPPELAPPPVSTPGDPVAAARPPAEPLPRGTTVLHIGDSFAGALGIDLNVQLREAGVRGVLKYETATYIPTWASGKELDTYLWKYHPDLVLVTLGANELEIPVPEDRAPTVRKLVSRLGGRPCAWVGPPLWVGARPELLETIRRNVRPCVYIDSTALLPDLPRARDHIHPAMQARKIWAKAVINWLGEHRVIGADRPWELRD